MIVFYTRSTHHLAPFIDIKQGGYTSKQFSDGEWYVQLEEEVADKTVWVITATNPPAEHVLELLLLLDVLQKNNAHIHILFTYFGYARQDRPLENEASSAHIMAKLLNLFSLEKIIIIHAHSLLLHNYLTFENIIPSDVICQTAQLYDAIAAPDQGAYDLVQALGKACQMETIFLTKMRPEQEIVKILEYDGIVKAKNILIVDDIIATGNTVIEVAKTLQKLGATQVSVWATHGIFSASAQEAIEKSAIKKVYVTNTLPQKSGYSKIEVINIAPLIKQLITSE